VALTILLPAHARLISTVGSGASARGQNLAGTCESPNLTASINISSWLPMTFKTRTNAPLAVETPKNGKSR